MLPLRSNTRSQCRGGADGGRRAFSLIEVVIAIAILVAIAALVLPSMLERTRGRAEREAVEIAKAACSRASSESQWRGVPILLAAVAETDHVRLVGSRVETGDDESGVVRELFSIDLPAGMTVTSAGARAAEPAPPSGGSESRAFGALPSEEVTAPRAGARTTLTLAFPDGRCAGGQFDLVTSPTRRTRFVLSEWTSSVRVRTIDTTSAEEKASEFDPASSDGASAGHEAEGVISGGASGRPSPAGGGS
ncbi:MAG: prepilin-type N-terminal cleavage/methylation domain-containing protein [Phycisphaerales bacterium]|nr:prepilin-type N-terminal cleavage/methylation domain-containing protein [Phycisphaerales bacterium]